MEYRSIELNLRIGCPIDCSYCPQEIINNSDHGDLKLFKKENLLKILDNATFDENYMEVFFAGFSEPFAHKNCLDFIELCQNHKFVSRVVVFTTGYRLSEDQIIFLSKLNKLKINFHFGKNDYMPNFDNSIWNKIHLIKKFLPKSEFINVGLENKDSNIEKILNQNGFDLKFEKIISRAGNLKNVGSFSIEPILIKSPVTCPMVTFKKRPVILPDGTALACTNDYGCELKIGNLLNGNWSDLDFDKIKNIQKNPNIKFPCFRNCHYAEPINDLRNKARIF